jgi:hypothetical protein
LADTYDTLPDYARGFSPGGTTAPIDANWRSPFIGKTVPDVVKFIRDTPRPPKTLNTRFCAVVTRVGLKGIRALICKSLDYADEAERLFDESLNVLDDLEASEATLMHGFPNTAYVIVA